MVPMARSLRSRGFATETSGMRLNVDCTQELLPRLEDRLARAAEWYERPVAIVGWSRGGTLGKILALRRPDLVAGLVTIVSPNVDPWATRGLVTIEADLLTRARGRGLRGVIGADCIHGDCGRMVTELMAEPFPNNIPYVALYSPQDRVVQPSACLDPQARLIEIHASHGGIGFKRRVLKLVGDELVALGPQDFVKVHSDMQKDVSR
ncbi:MAG: alpha/beta hydrolase [Actinomycetes bacterium]